MSLSLNRIYLILFTAILLIGFILRFYQLGKVPFGLYQDETAIGYNAYSILQTGRDEYGKKFPLYFKSFGDWKLPVYIYTATVPIKFLGLNEFSVRLPSAVFGFLTIPVFYFLILELTKKRNLSLISTFLLAINPWHLFYSRATFEVSIALFLFLLGTLLLIYAFRKGRFGLFILGTICFLIAFYSYNLTRLLAPLLYLFVLYFNKENFKNIGRAELLGSSLICLVLLIPFISTFLRGGGISSASGTLIFSSAVNQSVIVEFKTFLISFPGFISSTVFNSNILTAFEYIKHVVSYLSVPFYFISGDPHGNHGIGNVGEYYLFELPLVLAGLYLVLKYKVPGARFILGWAIIVVLVASLTREAPQATRSFFLIPTITFLSGLGVLFLYEKTIKLKNINLGYLILIVFSGFAVFNLIYYLTSYYKRFPVVYAQSWRKPEEYLSLFLRDEGNKYNKIIFDKEADFNYASLLFYQAYPPKDFQQSVIRENDDSEGFSDVRSFGKYEFRDIDWGKDLQSPGNLIITSSRNKPAESMSYRVFYYPPRTAVFPVGAEISQIPVEEEAYVVIETK